MRHKTKLERALETPLGAVGATRWLNSSQFEALYDVSRARIVHLIKLGVLQGFKLGHEWRIYNPGWDIVNSMRNEQAVLDNAPLLRTDAAAELLGVKPPTLKEWRVKGKLPGYRFNHVFYFSVAALRKRAQEIDRWNKKRGVSRETIKEWARKRLNTTETGQGEDPRPDPTGS